MQIISFANWGGGSATPEAVKVISAMESRTGVGESVRHLRTCHHLPCFFQCSSIWTFSDIFSQFLHMHHDCFIILQQFPRFVIMSQ